MLAVPTTPHRTRPALGIPVAPASLLARPSDRARKFRPHAKLHGVSPTQLHEDTASMARQVDCRKVTEVGLDTPTLVGATLIPGHDQLYRKFRVHHRCVGGPRCGAMECKSHRTLFRKKRRSQQVISVEIPAAGSLDLPPDPRQQVRPRSVAYRRPRPVACQSLTGESTWITRYSLRRFAPLFRNYP
jgi:hypothetical protein